MIANMNDDKLFFNIYDTYNMFVTNGHYGGKSGVYEQDEFLKIILDNEHLFKDIFRRREYLHICTNLERRSKNLESYTINTINPIIIGCLRYAINNLEKYKDQAIRILDFAIMHNKKIIDKSIEIIGLERTKNAHIHFSKIEYGAKGEIKHLTLEDTILFLDGYHDN